jgi:gliding motility-associated-like protein
MITHPNGETYMCSGSNGELRKIDANGGQVWYNNPNALFNTYEYWSLAFNCDLTKLVVGGSQSVFGLPPAIKGVIMRINTANGAMTSPTVVGNGSTVAIPPNVQEVSSVCQAPNGNFYFLTLDSVGAIKDDLSAVVFKASTGYHFDYYIPGYGFGTKQPISAIRAAGSCFYTQNGNTLDKRDLLTGAILASASIPGGISTTSFFGTKLNGNGGLDIDACGNVYVGSGNGVYKFDAALNLLSSATTPGEVYDVDVSANGEVAAAGRNFLATFAMGACAQQSFVCGNVLDVTATATSTGCTAPCSGTAAASPTGGTPPYSYLWSNGATNQQVIGLCAGIYTVLVTDATGQLDSATVSVSAPSAVNLTVASTPASCTLSDGTATVTVTGGTPPYAYSWSSSGNSSATVTGLAPGSYSVSVTDAAGCTATQSFVIGSPSTINLTVATTPGHCGLPDGTAGAAVTGGTPPYSFTWAPSGSSAASVSGLSAGNYSVLVTDASGCTVAQTFVITDTAGFTAAGLSIPVCGTNNGVAGVTVTGATPPVTYSWSPGGATASILSGLSSGIYTCVITDATGCSGSVSVNVIAYPDVIADAGPDVTIVPGDSIRLDASGGVDYQWVSGTPLSCTQCNDPVAAPSATTSYCVRVTDSNGCSATDCVTVTVNTECGEIFVPNAFSPDGADNPENEKECVYGRCIVSLEFSIYDRWGEKVFQTTDKEICWDGTYKGQKMNSGVFVYTLKAILLDGTEVTKTGDITLIR